MKTRIRLYVLLLIHTKDFDMNLPTAAWLPGYVIYNKYHCPLNTHVLDHYSVHLQMTMTVMLLNTNTHTFHFGFLYEEHMNVTY